MRTLNHLALGCTILLSLSNVALAARSPLDAWAMNKASILTKDCKSQTSFQWLKTYNAIDDELIAKIKLASPAIFSEEAPDSGFLDFVEVFYPQDLPEAMPMSSAYLDCNTEFFGFVEGSEKTRRNASLKAWGECVNREEEPTPFQSALGKCLDQLKKK